MRTWVDYWDSDHSIYVGERHKELHAAAVGRDILRQVRTRADVVLDHGCGEALYAEQVRGGCGRLILCEAAPVLRGRLAARLAGCTGIEVIAPDAVPGVADGSLDLIVANSLIQYLTREELKGLLDLWQRKLKHGGRLILADVIPPGVSPVTDALQLLRFGWKGGFLAAALVGLARTAFSDYRRIRGSLGFSTYSEPDILSLLGEHGYSAERIRPNFGHNQARMTIRATPTG